jgi:hypothetical protein
MADIKEAKKLLDEINAAVASYDPVLKEQARDILLKQAFGAEPKTVSSSTSKGIDTVSGPKHQPALFHQLVEKWTPGTQAEWVLLGAYYFQVVLGNESVTAFQVNKELKQHGTVIANVTASFDENINENPALIRQVGKSGKAKQAKKKYIITTSGIDFVAEKLNAQKQGYKATVRS